MKKFYESNNFYEKDSVHIDNQPINGEDDLSHEHNDGQNCVTQK